MRRGRIYLPIIQGNETFFEFAHQLIGSRKRIYLAPRNSRTLYKEQEYIQHRYSSSITADKILYFSRYSPLTTRTLVIFELRRGTFREGEPVRNIHDALLRTLIAGAYGLSKRSFYKGGG